MQYLTSSELRKIAPATQRMPASEDNLVDTRAFLRKLEKQGFQPVFAAQGTAHADANVPLKSRHLAVAAEKGGFAVAILNSHTIWRRAWIGAGFAEPDGTFVLGAMVPLPRWRGFDEPLDDALAYKGMLAGAKTILDGWMLEDHQRRWLAKKFSQTAYLKGHKQPLVKELYVKTEAATAYGLLIGMLMSARAGGLHPEPDENRLLQRKLKPITSPDAIMHAANATFEAGIAGLAKYKLGTYAFPSFSRGR